MQIISKNIKDTEKIAKDFVKLLGSKVSKSATVVGLYGNLGAGKTAFVQALGRHLKIKKKINSPTFVIMKKYPLKYRRPTSGIKQLFHLDAYRLKNPKELLHLGWAEIIKNRDNIIFIEWPENVQKVMPKRHHKIKISHTKEGYRKFRMN